MAIDYTKIFGDLGTMVRVHNKLQDAIDTINAESLLRTAQLDADAYDTEILKACLAADQGTISSLASRQTAEKSNVDSYLKTAAVVRIDDTHKTAADILDALISVMGDDSESVDACAVSMIPSSITEANDGGDQVSGYAAITGLSSANVDSAGILYVSVVDDGGGDFHVNLYNDTARGAGDLIAHTGTFTGAGTEALTADNSSGIGGSITIDTASPAADADITVTFSFGGSRTGNGTMGSWSAGQLARNADWRVECTSAATAGSEQWTIYRRIDGEDAQTMSTKATTAVAFSAYGVAFTIAAGGTGFAVGDEFRFSTTTDDAGTFLSYFRDQYSKELPSDATGSETIADSLAE